MTLAARITLLAQAIRDKLNAMTPRLVPTGGATGQALVKTSGSDNAVGWGPREVIFTGTTDASGIATLVFSPAFATKPFVTGHVDQVSTGGTINGSVVVVYDRTVSGCKIKTYKSKTTGILLGGSVDGLEVYAAAPYVVSVRGA